MDNINVHQNSDDRKVSGAGGGDKKLKSDSNQVQKFIEDSLQTIGFSYEFNRGKDNKTIVKGTELKITI